MQRLNALPNTVKAAVVGASLFLSPSVSNTQEAVRGKIDAAVAVPEKKGEQAPAAPPVQAVVKDEGLAAPVAIEKMKEVIDLSKHKGPIPLGTLTRDTIIGKDGKEAVIDVQYTLDGRTLFVDRIPCTSRVQTLLRATAEERTESVEMLDNGNMKVVGVAAGFRGSTEFTPAERKALFESLVRKQQYSYSVSVDGGPFRTRRATTGPK